MEIFDINDLISSEEDKRNLRFQKERIKPKTIRGPDLGVEEREEALMTISLMNQLNYQYNLDAAFYSEEEIKRIQAREMLEIEEFKRIEREQQKLAEHFE